MGVKKMAKGYLIANIRVHDKEIFEKFKAMSSPVISQYGGKLLVRNPSPDRREGDLTGLVVMLEFPSVEMAKTIMQVPQRHAGLGARVQSRSQVEAR